MSFKNNFYTFYLNYVSFNFPILSLSPEFCKEQKYMENARMCHIFKSIAQIVCQTSATKSTNN